MPYETALAKRAIDPLFHKRIQSMYTVTPEHLKTRSLYVADPAGCSHCTRGYVGRSVVSEIILPDEHFMELMREHKKRQARAYWFKTLEGIDLLGAAWLRALDGLISPIDIEHTVALIAPIEEHKDALELWSRDVDAEVDYA